ncbi:MAG: hypothetical protein A2096_06510 [Spirochaetes bacterium GWF1_41_5]|nr:MAG: hypothetical protein A2096_06510 [Spirochaetes bacterium GWF1_41_5]HBE04404.1 hypothetical protein [Spirochaetia bacterium]
MKKKKVYEYLYTMFFMILISLVFVFPLCFLYNKTAPLIKAGQASAQKKAILYAAGIYSADINAAYRQLIRENGVFFHAEKENPVLGIIASGPGLWGEITAAVFFSPDGGMITGIDFISQNETPGLGARIAETRFKEQFRGKKIPVRIKKENSPSENSFDAVTGASISSAAVMNIINSAAEKISSRGKNSEK